MADKDGPISTGRANPLLAGHAKGRSRPRTRGEPMTLSIEWLLEPIAPQAFFTEYYERQPLLIACGEPRRLEPLLSLSAIDRFLATTSPCHPDVFLVDAARKLSAEDYTLADPDGVGQLDLPRAYELFRTGATISVRHLHQSLPELWRPVPGGRKDVQRALSDQYLPIATRGAGLSHALRQPRRFRAAGGRIEGVDALRHAN